MKKYPKYKDSGVEWIGEIPEGWSSKKYKHLYSSGMGNTILKEDLIDGGGIPVFSATESDAVFGFVNQSNLILEKGDIIIPARGNSIGHIMLVRERCTSTQTTIYSKKKSDSVNDDFTFYFLKAGRSHLFHFDRTAIPQITVSQVQDNVFILPPLPEQQQIVTYLDHKTTLIDQIISGSEKKIELLKEQRTANINHAVTKGLNPKVKMKDSGVEWIGEIPEGWEVKKMKYCLCLISEKGETTKGDIKISPENVENETGVCFNLYSDYEGEGMKFKNGDILLNKLRIYLKKIVLTDFDGFSMGEMIVLRTVDGLNKYYHYMLFNQGLIDLLNEQSTGVKLPRVSPDIILNTSIVYPNLPEQQQIVNYLDQKTKEIDDLISSEQKRIELMKEYRQSLISEVVTGKIKVTNH